MKNHEEMLESLFERREAYEKESKRKKILAKKSAAVLSCLCLTVMLGVGLWRSDAFVNLAAGHDSPAIENAVEDVIEINAIVRKSHEELPSSERAYFDPQLYDESRVSAADYYGAVIYPEYIPSGLIAAPNDGSLKLVSEKSTGEIKRDTEWLTYWNAFYPDGSHLSECDGGKGFTVKASKIGRPDSLRFMEETKRASLINGTEVYLSFCEWPWKYDEKGKATEFYDFYIAEFTYSGINFCVEASNLSEGDVIKIIKSIIR